MQRQARELELIDLTPRDHPEAVAVLARGMRDNPIHLAVFGPDTERRRRSLERMFTGFFRVFTKQQPFALRDGGRIVAVTGVAPSGSCMPSLRQQAQLLPTALANGPGSTLRALRWLKAWSDRDPDEPHSHLGPLAVDAQLQGQGIGSRLLGEYCRRLDAAGQLGYLETDKRENVGFYSKQGFETVAEADVLGVPNWFMVRRPRAEG